MIPFILLLWLISFGLAALFQVDFTRVLIDATSLTSLSIATGYILTVFYEHRQHRTYINWIQLKNNETKHKGF